MKLVKKILAFGLISVMVGSFIGCSRTNEDKKIGMVLSTLNNPFFVTMKNGAEKEAERLGFKLIVLDSQNDAAKERSNVEDLIELGVTALLINPTDSDAVVKSIEVANNRNIPVVTLDRQSNGGYVTSHIASDNVAGGAMAAEYILNSFEGNDTINIVELQGISGSSATRDRGAGLHSIIDNNKRFNLVSSQSADFDRQKGLQVMENIIQGNGKIDAVFAHNDEMALGAQKAIKASGLNTIVVGFDGVDDALDAIESGDIKATVAQQADLIGSLSVELAQKIYNSEEVESEIVAG
ncbi:ribose ABC transporter substrate-binding protein RbsB [Clostridium vincentii]|uniref:D-ribose-binding periplasmic protein n=1 Tax=Clostridium vincentii TaxID=52704 RepID=A0A2T0B7D5_9CLOT|nr:ribose ABC transporter substrate-binding protein RbsB [Clostridium vincentii]PRR79707.1 D-ribose-binding periplasmic protein precursor [Clostridium vincentii]